MIYKSILAIQINVAHLKLVVKFINKEMSPKVVTIKYIVGSSRYDIETNRMLSTSLKTGQG